VLVVVRLLETLVLKYDYRQAGQVARRFMPILKQTGETPELVTAYCYQAQSLLQNLDVQAAHELMVEALRVADRLDDGRARAYARGFLLEARIMLGLDSLEAADRMIANMMDDCVRFGDNFIRNWSYWFVSWGYLYRGLLKEAREVAARLLASGQERNDPRALGMANWLLGWICIVSDVHDGAWSHADECLRVAVAPHDRLQGAMVKAVSGIFMGRVREGLGELEKLVPELERLGTLYGAQDGPRGVALAILGRISEGVRVVEQQIARCDKAGDRAAGTWSRIILAEIYIHILSGNEKPSTATLIKNLWTIIGVMMYGARRAQNLLQEAAAHKQLSERGVIIARINFDLGTLSAMKKRRERAKDYFERARAGAESQGAEKLLQKIDAALLQLGYGK
jgi:hypothetical protein